MSLIEWDESFSANNTEIDSQHKKWINIYNRMCKTMLEGDLGSQKEILELMLNYTRYHFKFEEEYIDAIDFPGAVKHTRLHKDFDALIYQYYRDVRDGDLVLNSELLKVIRSWLLNHILVEDKEYSLFTND